MNLLAIALAATIGAGMGGPSPADGLGAAKELYGAAAYEDALAMLSRLSAGGAVPDTAIQIDEYRSLCLYALGRTAEARSAVRDLLQRDPLFDLDKEDLSPRIAAMFTEVRKELLPDQAKEKYIAAKAALDAKQYASAETQLADVRRMIDQAVRLGVKDDSMNDLGVLVDGFHDLARAALAKEAAAAAAAQAPPPVETPNAAEPSPAVPKEPRIYDAGDADVAPPVPIIQSIPPFPQALIQALRSAQGLLVVTVDADGRVEEAVIRRSLNAVYDQMVIDAAKTWRYKPAVRNGAPVRYVKAITLAFHADQ